MKKNITFTKSLVPLIGLIAAAAGSIFIWDAGMSIPLIIGVILAAAIAITAGWEWNEVQKMMVDGVSRALPAVFILLTIGMIIGSWIASGTIPTMIYYGMMLINPAWFVPITALITGIVSITLGTSFTAIATVGLAFMGIGEVLGFSPALIAGAIVSGAYFGDKLSPLSDTTNVAAAMVETDLFSHVKHMLWDTIPAFLLSFVLFWLFGSFEVTAIGLETSLIDVFLSGLNDAFVIHPLLLLLPVITVFLMIKRVPALPTLMGVGFLGAIIAGLVQGSSVSSIVQFMTSGFVSETGVEAVDSLLNRGGLTSMLETVGILIIATAFGGILEGTGSFKVLTNRMLEKVRTTGTLIASTLLTTFIVALASGAQFLAVILPARTFVDKYKEMNIDTKNLSRTVESMGTVGINLIPWSVPAVFATGILGVSPWEYIPYAFFIYLVPLMNLLFGFTGWTITRKDYNHEKLQHERKISL
ncbi:Na+/H+ antiporter NhaC [Oceanobacillus alkalisoli]|uniref:Na+/H+ antiporter NhaC n=1 Tax=Oceanobacillus alkalisoli TaxID=2925113 RepID=UPI001EF0EFD2|nr:Na+/H+ antiporter NhaC [Oceanobacillus alkalisoli]MCF3944710.1 Na+/H+ antiporter NhaC [Oceanobacillus alkalisoli]MCG5105074.1 Na+/H+ antiporter NhaC [Oceanobacillus alkalisoli]